LRQDKAFTWNVMASKSSLPSSSSLAPWRAEIRLRADRPDQQTRVRKDMAVGPLQIQKVLYPEGPSVAHVFLLHPPSGIAQSDQLEIHISAEGSSHSVYATPGATRWYKALSDATHPASQTVFLRLSDRAIIEWLPYENLYFDQTWGRSNLEIRLEPGCRLLGWDLHQFGRTSCGETWQSGRVTTGLSLYLGDDLLWTESAHWDTGHTNASHDHHQLAGYSITGSLWAYGTKLQDDDYERLAATLPADDSCIAGLSQLSIRRDPQPSSSESPSDEPTEPEALVVMRLLSKDPEQARTLCEKTRAFLRPFMMNMAAEDLRIWAT
jgi:urease accessory protein